MSSKKVLHLFSGGRDSYLTAALLSEQGFEVHSVTFDTGHIEGLEYAGVTHDSLESRYGDLTTYLGVYPCKGMLYSMMQKLWQSTISELTPEFRNVPIQQLHCLTCRAAMYTTAIYLACKHNYAYISDGSRDSQGFIVDGVGFRTQIRELCEEYGISLLSPISSLDDDTKRKAMLVDRGLFPHVHESQCYLSSPLKEPLDERQKFELLQYMKIHLLPKMKELIEENRNYSMETG